MIQENLKKYKTYLPIVCKDKEVNQSSGLQLIDWGLRQKNIPLTWKVSAGEGITVLVIDTGHPFHSDLDGNVEAGENFIDNEGFEDLNGHQTHCTGIICAKNNKFGMVGVAPKAKCISVKALNQRGSGTIKSLVSALDYAIKIKPDIVSMSLGSPRPHIEIEKRIKELYELNIPVVCAAGNTGLGGVNWPAAYKETFAIGAYSENGLIADFSSKGSQVDWAAPGVDIYSTYLNNNYIKMSGTSMACPFFVGILALMLSKHKKQKLEEGKNDCRTIDQIKEHLKKYSIDKGDLGKDNSWGYGVIDVQDLIGEKIEEKPDIPHPYPDPDPKPKPEPKPKPSPKEKNKNPWIRMDFAWIGLAIVSLIGLFLIFFDFESEEEFVPYIDENGNVDWDKKYELEKNERRTSN